MLNDPSRIISNVPLIRVENINMHTRDFWVNKKNIKEFDEFRVTRKNFFDLVILTDGNGRAYFFIGMKIKTYRGGLDFGAEFTFEAERVAEIEEGWREKIVK